MAEVLCVWVANLVEKSDLLSKRTTHSEPKTEREDCAPQNKTTAGATDVQSVSTRPPRLTLS